MTDRELVLENSSGSKGFGPEIRSLDISGLRRSQIFIDTETTSCDELRRSGINCERLSHFQFASSRAGFDVAPTELTAICTTKTINI